MGLPLNLKQAKRCQVMYFSQAKRRNICAHKFVKYSRILNRSDPRASSSHALPDLSLHIRLLYAYKCLSVKGPVDFAPESFSG